MTTAQKVHILMDNSIIMQCMESTHLVRFVGALVVRVGLYGGDVGIHQDHLDALFLQSFDCLTPNKN